ATDGLTRGRVCEFERIGSFESAKTLGLTVAPTLLARADEAIAWRRQASWGKLEARGDNARRCGDEQRQGNPRPRGQTLCSDVRRRVRRARSAARARTSLYPLPPARWHHGR